MQMKSRWWSEIYDIRGGTGWLPGICDDIMVDVCFTVGSPRSFIVKSRGRVKSTADQLHKPQRWCDRFSFLIPEDHHVDDNESYLRSAAVALCVPSEGRAVHSGR